jgi:3-dehydroquinate dehydratase I
MGSVRSKPQSIENSKPFCVSVYGRDLPDLFGRVKLARSYNPKFVELRLDYLASIKTSDLEEIGRNLTGNEIVTFRKQAEGGVAKIDQRTHEKILHDLISICRPSYIDIEISTLQSLPSLIKVLENSNSKLIASSHDFTETEVTFDLKRIIIRCALEQSPFLVKVVRQANEFSDNLRILSLYGLSKKISPAYLVAFCSGSIGIFSRIACVNYGSPFTYASLHDKATAPGQLDAGMMKTLLTDWK